MNKIAMQKCLRKFSKSFFKVRDSVFVEQINHFIHALEICHEKPVIETRVKIVRIFAHHFCANDHNKA